MIGKSSWRNYFLRERRDVAPERVTKKSLIKTKANIIFSCNFKHIFIDLLMFVSNSEDPLCAEISEKFP